MYSDVLRKELEPVKKSAAASGRREEGTPCIDCGMITNPSCRRSKGQCEVGQCDRARGAVRASTQARKHASKKAWIAVHEGGSQKPKGFEGSMTAWSEHACSEH